MMKKATPPTSIFNALILYGVVPIVLLFLSSFIDWEPLSFLHDHSTQKVTESSVKAQNNDVNKIITKIHDGLKDEDDLTSSKVVSPSEHSKRRERASSRKHSEPDADGRKDRAVEMKRNEKRQEGIKRKSDGNDRISDSRKSFIDSVDENIRHLRAEFQVSELPPKVLSC